MAETKKNGINKWTVLFYFAGDNNLSSGMISQLKAITDAGYQEDTSVIVHFDPNTIGTHARIFDVNHSRKQTEPKTVIGDGENPFVRNIAEDCFKRPERPGVAKGQSLRSFLNFAIEDHPAENYMLFLIGHGTIVANDAFLPDVEDDAVSAITLNQLGEILKEFTDKAKAANGKFQLVGFHSCSMSAVEVAYELKNTARYMMGTQGLAFVGSWPYRQLLKKLFRVIEAQKHKNGSAQASDDSDEVVRNLLDSIHALSFYNAEDFALAGYSHDLSLCSLAGDKVERLTLPLKQLTLALKKGLGDPRATELILLAHWKSQSYWQETYTDLVDFCKCLSELCSESTHPQVAIRAACDTVIKTLEPSPSLQTDPWRFDRLVVYSDYFGAEYQYSHGLSIYFPWASPSETVLRKYRRYAFTLPRVSPESEEPESPDSWLSFLKQYFASTQREVRGEARVSTASIDNKRHGVVTTSNGNGTPPGRDGDTKPIAALAGMDTKPTPTLAGSDTKPTPTLAVEDTKPTPTLAVEDTKPTPTLAVEDTKPTPTLAGGDTKPTPTLAGGDTKPTPTLAGGDTKPTPTLAGGDTKPTPTLAGGDTKPTPSLGGGVFGFTVIKNHPSPRDAIISSRPRAVRSQSWANGFGAADRLRRGSTSAK